jgi:hypothetical protein
LAIIYCINEKLKRRLSVFADVVFFLAIMSPRNEGFQAVAFDGATSDAKEPLIATGDAEEEDQGLEERDLARLKLGSLLFGLLVGFFFMSAAALGVNILVVYFEVKSTTNVIVFILLWGLFILWSLITVMAPYVLISEIIRNRGHSKELREDMILQFECHFRVGVLAGICLAWTIAEVLLGTRVHVEYTFAIMVFAVIWCKVTMAAEEEDQGLEEGRDSSSFKLSSLLLGLLVGFFLQLAFIGANCLVIYYEMKSNTNVIIFSLLWSLLTVVAAVVFMWEFIRNLRRSEEILEGTVLHMECRFVVGAAAGICLALMFFWASWHALLSIPLGLYIVVAYIWYKVMTASVTDSKPSSTRRSTAEQTMMNV